VGIPCSITDDDLENEVVAILSDIDVNVTTESFQACHRLKKKDRVIVKFKNRKDCMHSLKNKKMLREINYSKKYGSKMLYINESLCGFYRGLWNKCKKLKNIEKILRINENGNALSIGHDNDFIKYFPSIDFSLL